jgi:SAM-dependent methyltransferase
VFVSRTPGQSNDGSTPCPGDLNGDSVVGVEDLPQVLDRCGDPDPLVDVDGSCLVDVGDVLVLRSEWGGCEAATGTATVGGASVLVFDCTALIQIKRVHGARRRSCESDAVTQHPYNAFCAYPPTYPPERRMTERVRVEARVHSEYAVDSFTKMDGGIRFYGFVNAVILKAGEHPKVLDFGAGRGCFDDVRRSGFARHLQDLRHTGAEVWAADIDPVVLTHPCSDHQVHFDPSEPLPFEDEQFDVIVSDMVFEHIEDPAAMTAELKRILKPDGWICARTPNKWGYLTLCSRMIPNTLHDRLLKHIQPFRKAEDVFPTVYKLNSPRDIKKQFPRDAVCWYYDIAEPAYHFNNRLVYRLFLLLHRLLPPKFAVCMCVFVHKRGANETA